MCPSRVKLKHLMSKFAIIIMPPEQQPTMYVCNVYIIHVYVPIDIQPKILRGRKSLILNNSIVTCMIELIACIHLGVII